MAGMNVVVITVESGSSQVLPAADALALVIGDPLTYRLEPPFGTGAFTSEGLLRAFQLGTGNPAATYNDLINALRLVTANDVPLAPITHLTATNVQAAFAEIVAGDVDRDADIVTALANAAAATVTANAAGVSATAALALATAAIAQSNIETSGTLASNSDTKVPSSKAVRTYVAAALTAIGSLNPLGVVDASANPNYPAANKGDLYFISVAGKVGGGAGASVGAGDYIVCFVNGSASGNQATVGANWGVVHFASAIAILSVPNVFTAAQIVTVSAAGTAFTVSSTDAGAAAGPILLLFRDSATPAAADALGELRFPGRRSDAAVAVYAVAAARILNATAGVEAGSFDIRTLVAGVEARRISVQAGLTTEGVTGGDKGVNTANIGSIYESNVRVATYASTHTPTDALIAATMADLWGMDRITLRTQGSNSAADVTAAWDAAMAKAGTRSKTCVMTGHGNFINPNAASLLVPASVNDLTVIGCGREVSQIQGTWTGGSIVKVGAYVSGTTHISEAQNIRFEHFAIIAPAAHSAGAIVDVVNTRYFVANHMKTFFGFKSISFGAGTGQPNDCRDATIIDLLCQNSTLSNASDPYIHCLSGAGLRILGARVGASNFGSGPPGTTPSPFIMDGPTYNFDSIICNDVLGENLGSWIRSIGHGLSSLQWNGGDVDGGGRSNNMFDITPSSGICKDWTLRGGKVGGTAGRLVNINPSGAATVDGIHVDGLRATATDLEVVFVKVTDCENILVTNNIMRNCGRSAKPLISAGMRSGNVMGNHAKTDTGGAYTVLCAWTGASAPAVRSGPTAVTNGQTRAFNNAQNGSGANSGLFSGVI